ncbi:MAG: carbohydrate ABC transporter permease [Sphaerochaeta sp.]|jgi:raffinose/stachyose/melibiose transport system permease protein|uniref:carbohydrate ABC transporter permease n=1 Tax=unclassified Sphaerochaeta TaxID=2637943 RepID=UPI000E903E8F|nr:MULTISPECIES: carbohydrate ABC transporter permease [unclassified Sphaerochaeta]MCK9600905.1 carbohydrate ABC transporter permease [Sphaerochaeta sp.]MDX9825562.1 carbohydrate ABC transporter permease [Sphaerochaeta sp.]MEA4864370.1 carbohydrate ABC transporter permease [Sphaerochaeta sp.]HAP56903.1 carbohydrate ABC transporter permease [Sphaerochaeta sp.]HBO35898.1 carbohydrate ABC transporter permease [Sphaerochaeta sp.]
MKKEPVSDKLFKAGIYLFCIVVLILTGFPLLFLVFNSFKSLPEYMMNIWQPPKKLFFGNYKLVFAPTFLKYFINSLIVSVSGVTLVILVSSLMAFVFAKFSFKVTKGIFFLVVAGMMIPIHTTLIPIYSLSINIGVYDTLFALIGPYISFNIPVSVFIMTQFFKEMPKELDEAAKIDGGSLFLIYRKIVMPLSGPAVSTVGVYTFLTMWNEFVYALVMIDTRSKKTLSLGIRDFYGFQTINIPAVLTAILVGSLPVLIFYFVAQDRVINGLTQGALKG